MRLVSTTRPTRSSLQVRALLLSMVGTPWFPPASGKELAKVGIARGRELVGAALEDHGPVAEHEELRAGDELEVLVAHELRLVPGTLHERARHVEGVAELVGDEDRAHPVEV